MKNDAKVRKHADMKKRKNELHNEKGAALIMVLCALCVVIALMLSMVLASYQVVSLSRQSARKEQARIAAETFDQVITDQLGTADSTLNQYLEENIKSNPGTTDWKPWAEDDNKNITTKNEKNIAVTNNLQNDNEGKLGTMNAIMYWHQSNSTVTLMTEITDDYHGQTYTVTSRYTLNNALEMQSDWTWKKQQ